MRSKVSRQINSNRAASTHSGSKGITPSASQSPAKGAGDVLIPSALKQSLIQQIRENFIMNEDDFILDNLYITTYDMVKQSFPGLANIYDLICRSTLKEFRAMSETSKIVVKEIFFNNTFGTTTDQLMKIVWKKRGKPEKYSSLVCADMMGNTSVKTTQI